MNTYYEPEIREFKVGFKFEILDPEGWKECIYSTTDSVQNLIDAGLWRDHRIRVKALSVEDILNIRGHDNTYMFQTSKETDDTVRLEAVLDNDLILALIYSKVENTVKLALSGAKTLTILLNDIICRNLAEFMFYLEMYKFM